MSRSDASEIKEYTVEIEKLFIQFFMTDPELFVRCVGVINPEHFSDYDNKKSVQFIKDYSQKYASLPKPEMLKSVVGFVYDPIEDCGEAEKEWFLAEYETFARYKSLEKAILDAPDLLLQHRYGEVEQMVKDAVSIGLVKDLGTDYFKDPKGRLDEVANSRGAISSGFRDIDDKLYGGLNRGEITIIAGQSGAGKSIFLQNFAVKWVSMGLNVVYLSLELSERLCAMRMDAMISDYSTKEVLKNREDVDLKLRMYNKNHGGHLQIKQLKNGCTANDIKAYIKEYEIQSGTKVDAILLDYLDLCMPTNAKVSPENLFVKDKYVTENMRDLAVELDCLFVTASQLNRNSHEADGDIFGHKDIAGGMSKINTADNVLAIYVTPAMKESGRYQLQFLKTRSSSGVGSKVDLAFDPRTLKLSDLDNGMDDSLTAQTKTMLDRLRENKKPTEKEGDEDEKPKIPANSLDSANKLHSILNKIKK